MQQGCVYLWYNRLDLETSHFFLEKFKFQPIAYCYIFVITYLTNVDQFIDKSYATVQY